jgi:ActR/RegA family two-component response regulator
MTDSGNASRHLLVIDDDPSCRETMARLLRQLGHTVEAAESVAAALMGVRVPVTRRQPGSTGRTGTPKKGCDS